jgi:hypothetical protein
MTVHRFKRWVLTLATAATVISCAATARPPASQSEAPPTVEHHEVAPEKPLVNTIRWTTASEVENFGFDVYRSTSEDGPFERITAEPIAGAGTTDEPQPYVFVDDTIDPTVGYYYYLESISMQGVRERFSPINYSPPKRNSE